MDNLTEINSQEPVSVLGCKVPMSMKGKFIQLAAANKMNVNVQLAYMVQEFIANGGKLDDGTKAKKLNDEIAKLKAEIEQVRKDAKKSDLEAQEATKVKKTVTDLQKQLDTLKSEKTALQVKIADANKAGLSATTQSGKFFKELQEARNEKTQLSAKIRELENELKTEKSNYEKLRKNIDSFKEIYLERNKKSVLGFPEIITDTLNSI